MLFRRKRIILIDKIIIKIDYTVAIEWKKIH